MPESTPSFAPEILLENQSMLRRLARALVSEDRVDDVVQDTWLAFLRRPPRAAGAAGAWLASVLRSRAVDAQRRGARRLEREHAAARAEAVEPVDRAVQRATVQRDVVEAVLALREPYRSVVLLTYFDALSPTRVAAQLGRSPATVRSQLHRAHALLREALDRRYGGKREAWCVALLPLAKVSGWLVAGAAGLATVALGVGIAKSIGSSREHLVPVLSPLAAEVASPDGGAGSKPLEEESANERLAIVQDRRSATTSSAIDIEKLSARELLDLAVQAKRVVAARVLEPEKRFFTEQAALLAMPNTGIARLLRSGGTRDITRAVHWRGGGVSYSFANASHSYDDHPDLVLASGAFLPCAREVALLAEIGDVPLETLTTEQGPPPPVEVAPRANAGWDLFWADYDDKDRERAWTDTRFQTLRSPLEPSKPGTSYLLRSYEEEEYSHLVGFRVLGFDEYGCTIAWRILKRWPVPGSRGRSNHSEEHPEIAAGPAWLNDLSLEQLVEMIEHIRQRARVILLEVPKAVEERYHALTEARPRSFGDMGGFARILPRSEWNQIIDLREGGAYFSFRTRSNEYGGDSDIELQGDRFGSGFAGHDKGYLVDLGVFPFEQLSAVMGGELPDSAGAREREALKLLRTMRSRIEDDRRVLPEEVAERLTELGIEDGVRAQLGHTYALRTALYDSHDHLVVFTVIADDGAGLTLAWRVIEIWPVLPEPRNR
jgi:RNA polymerase sigma-70 factor (ECF subfamily)